jgi:hypothetical protein
MSGGPILVRGTMMSKHEAGFRRSLKTRLRLSTGLLAVLVAVTPAGIDPVQISLATPAAHAGDNGTNNTGNNDDDHGNSNGSHYGNDDGDSDDNDEYDNSDDGDHADHDDVVEEELSDLDEEFDQELDDGAEAEALGSGWN